MIYRRPKERSISFAGFRLLQDFAKLADAIIGICTLGLFGGKLELKFAEHWARHRIKLMRKTT